MTKSLNLALMFLLELAVYASVAYWGFTVSDNWAVRVLVAAGAVVLFGAVWSVFGSPRARVPVHRGPAAVLAALFVLNGLLRWRWGQSAGAIRPGGRG
jgi:membrane protein YdbS with pleckstrin-like domain